MTDRLRYLGPWGSRSSHKYIPDDYEKRPKQGHLESGQVYVERIVSSVNKRYTNWTKDYKSESMTQISHRRRVGLKGAASLREMAVSEVARKMKDIREEDIQGIPERIGKALWTEITARSSTSIHLIPFLPD